jgi:hypothetical protein
MGVPVARGEQARLRREVPPAPSDPPSPRDQPPLALAPARPFRLECLYLLDPVANETTPIEAIVFNDEGIGVIEHRGQPVRVLPWSSVSAQVVEEWSGGLVPEWWVDPELDRDQTPKGPGAPAPTVTDPDARVRAWPSNEPGSLIGVQTPTGTYRFLLPGTDPVRLADRINAIAGPHRGPSATATVPTVPEERPSRRRARRSAEERSTWSRIQPYLVALLIVFIATSVTLILLQSAGVIHLPFLGGANSGSLGRPVLRSR